MLNGAGNPAGDVQVRGNDLSRLPHLVGLRTPARVHRRSRRADRRAQKLRQLLQDTVSLGAFHAAAAGDDDVRFCDVDLAGRFLLHFQDLGLRFAQARVELDDRARLRVLNDGEHVRPKRCHLGRSRHDHLAEALAGVHGPDGQKLPVGNLDIRAVRGHPGGQLAHQGGGQVFPLGGRAEQQDRGIVLLYRFGDGRCMGACRIGFEGRVVGHEYFIHTVFSKLGGHGFHAGAQQNGAHLIAELVRQLPGRAGQLEADLAQRAVSLFCYNPYTLCHISYPP